MVNISFITKANLHLYYLKIIMILVIILLYEIKFYNNLQIIVTSFIIIFNITFTQNLINNLKLVNS